MTSALSLTLFGSPYAKVGEQDLAGRITGKSLALFVYLAITNRPHTHDVLPDLFWNELPKPQARHHLDYLVAELRKAVGGYITITPQTIGFNGQRSYWLDVDVLRTTLTTQPHMISTQMLQATLNLYRGEFLAGFNVYDAPIFEAWVVHEREELHNLAIQGFYTLAERYQQQGDAYAGLATTQRLLQWEPWHESGNRLQMQLLVATGQRAAALAQYALCRQVLADELGVEPEAATTALYEQIRSGQDAVVIRGQGDEATNHGIINDKLPGDQDNQDPPFTQSPSHNLPGQLTPFFGREEAIAELVATLLSPDYRLVTLVGEGGIGKTRLALAVAQSIYDLCFTLDDGTSLASAGTTNLPVVSQKSQIVDSPFPDGVWFVPLAGLAPTLELQDKLATTVAAALLFPLNGNTALAKQIEVYLRHKRLLLIFDNFEHLLPAAADFLLRLLQNCPHISALVTSRHLLNLQAEYPWRMDGLSVPPPAATLAAANLTEYSSVALFVERARRVNRNFALTPANQAAIVAICRMVEGLPLAIELAAALTKQYTFAQLGAALQHNYKILASTFADLAPNHRSIKVVLDDSWRFLAPDEALILANCSLFLGGFTCEAALMVTGATPALLGKFVDQSLLQVHQGRFTMHELVRQYAAGQLAQFPERQSIGVARHAAYYMDLLYGLKATLLLHIDAQYTMQRELDNVRAAWRWSVEQGDLILLDMGLESLQHFCRLAGMYGEAIRLFEIALIAVRQAVAVTPSAHQPQQLLARFLCHAAQFHRRSGGVEKGETLANEALDLGRGLADPALQALAYHELARLAQVRGHFSSTRALADQACSQARLAHLPHLTAECLNDLGFAVSLCVAPLAAGPYFQEALHWLQHAPNRYLEARIISNLGFIYLACHEYQSACRYLRQALSLKRQLYNREDIVVTLIYLGHLWMALGEYDAAQQEYEQVLAILQTIHNPYWETWLHVSYARLRHLRGDPGAARTACTLVRQMAQQRGIHLYEHLALIYLGHALMDLGDLVGAGEYYQQAITLQQQANWGYRTTDAQVGFAANLLAQNKLAAALVQVEAVLTQMAQQGLAAAEEPFRVYWTCVHVLQAHGDARALQILQDACRMLLEQAMKIDDEVLRHSFLENVVVNRDLLALAEATRSLAVDA